MHSSTQESLVANFLLRVTRRGKYFRALVCDRYPSTSIADDLSILSDDLGTYKQNLSDLLQYYHLAYLTIKAISIGNRPVSYLRT